MNIINNDKFLIKNIIQSLYNKIYFKILTKFFYIGKVRVPRVSKESRKNLNVSAGKIPEFKSGESLGTIEFLLKKA